MNQIQKLLTYSWTVQKYNFRTMNVLNFLASSSSFSVDRCHRHHTVVGRQTYAHALFFFSPVTGRQLRMLVHCFCSRCRQRMFSLNILILVLAHVGVEVLRRNRRCCRSFCARPRCWQRMMCSIVFTFHVSRPWCSRLHSRFHQLSRLHFVFSNVFVFNSFHVWSNRA